MKLREAFQEIRIQFEHESHKHPGLRHFWLQADQFVPRLVLESAAQIYLQPFAEVTQWTCENGCLDVSSFVGGEGKVECFKRLA